jgi:hypothetical protein
MPTLFRPSHRATADADGFPKCQRHIYKIQRVESSKFVPRPGVETPVPAWQRMEWAVDVLPAGDPARDPGKS